MASAIIPLGLSILSSWLQFLCPSSLGTHGTRAPTNEPRTISPPRHRASFWRHNHCMQCAHPDLGPGSHMVRYNSNLERCSILETRSHRPEGTKRPFLSRNMYDLHLRCRVMFLRISLHTNTQPSNFTSRRHDMTIILFSMRPILSRNGPLHGRNGGAEHMRPAGVLILFLFLSRARLGTRAGCTALLVYGVPALWV